MRLGRPGWGVPVVQFLSNLVEIDDYYIDPDTYIAEWEGRSRCLSAVLTYASLGWSVFPAPPGTKQSYESKSSVGDPNRPWGKTSDPDEIRRLWQRYPDANVGLPTGAENGIFVVEADTVEGHGVDGIASLRALEAEHGQLPPTLTAVSPSGSRHHYFKHPGNGIKVVSNAIALGVDVKGDGGMVIAPPSVKPGVSSFGSYCWTSNLPIADAPDWLVKLITEVDITERASGEEPEADPKLIAAALAVIPNEDVDWDDWNKVGMAAWRATGGSEEGFDAFDEWSQHSAKYDARTTAKKWEAYFTSPPDQIAAGTIIWMANEANPRWWDNYDAQVQARLNAAADDEELHALIMSEFDAEDAIKVKQGIEPSQQPEARVEDAKVEDAKTEDTKSSGKSEQPKQEQPKQEQPKQEYAEPSTAPVDLWAKFGPPQLPRGLLPRVIEEYAIEKSKVMGADASGLAIASLTVCAAVIPDSIQLKVKRHDNWMMSTRLWTGLVGDPSAKKSPIIRQAARRLISLDLAMGNRYFADKERWDALSREERQTTAAPRQTRLLIEDTTIEAAQEVLRDSPNGVLCLRDELSGWFGSMDKYAGHRGAAMDRGFWLQAWNGGSYTYNRISRRSGIIPHLSISVLGGIQPEPMREIAEGTVDDGLIQRIIPIMVAPATMGNDASVSEAEERYDKLIERLHKREVPFDHLTFDDGALRIRRQMEQKNLELMACRAFNRKLAAH
jgi:hypothetical protein